MQKACTVDNGFYFNFSSGKSRIGGWKITGGKLKANGELELDQIYLVNGSKSHFKGVYDREKGIIKGNLNINGAHTTFQLREV